MAASKDHVRELYYLKRSKIPEHTRIETDNKICEMFFQAIDLSKVKVIHSYLPIERRIEVNTYPILNILADKYPHIRIVLPYTVMSEHTLKHFYWNPGEVLIENKWGIPEPDPLTSKATEIKDIDIVIVPLLAYDLKGHRVGYGAGYYDRFLANCREETMIIGLSHFAPEDQWIKSEEYDIDLHYCITAERVYQFK